MQADRATDAQRWQIADLFAKFGCVDMGQIRADLRELTAEDADALIGELRAALAVKRVSDG